MNFKEIAIPLKISRLDSLHTFSLPATWVMINVQAPRFVLSLHKYKPVRGKDTILLEKE